MAVESTASSSSSSIDSPPSFSFSCDLQATTAAASQPNPKVFHATLGTTFRGIVAPTSSKPTSAPESSSSADDQVGTSSAVEEEEEHEPVMHQYLGIKFATIPGRFRLASLVTNYKTDEVDATSHGPICPQTKRPAEELLFGIPPEDLPRQTLKQNEFECLNLNITCPAPSVTLGEKVPVMLWIHGGGDRGSGSHWIYDGVKLVRKSVNEGKPVMVVTVNYRLGLLGFATSPAIRNANVALGDSGAANYGLDDQRLGMEWVHRYIREFGGDPENVTLFGSGSGGADIICHLLSRSNCSDSPRLFHRAIVQSPIFEPILSDVGQAGWMLSRLMSSLQVGSSVDKFRIVPVDKLGAFAGNMRVVDDGHWFKEGWVGWFEGKREAEARAEKEKEGEESRNHHHHPHPHQHLHVARRNKSRSRSRNGRSKSREPVSPSSTPTEDKGKGKEVEMFPQPLIIGDSCCDSLLWSVPISMWTSASVSKRLKAICQSVIKTNSLLRAYDLGSSSQPTSSSYATADEAMDEQGETIEKVLELVNDARVAWPTERIAENAKKERGGKGVWRYVFDQEGTHRGLPHYAADLGYLFDNVPLPEHMVHSTTKEEDLFFDTFDVDEEDECDGDSGPSDKKKYASVTIRTSIEDDEWATAPVDTFTYVKVRDSIQSKWISFAHGQDPWKEDRVMVFGPEGEAGERSLQIFEGRRRRRVWGEVFEPLGRDVVMKVGIELSRGPGGH